MVGWCCNGMSEVVLFMKSYIIKNADFLGKNWCLAFSALFDVSNVVWPCFTCLYLRNVLLCMILINHYPCSSLLTKNFTKNSNNLLFHCEGFFLKTKFISAFMIVVNLRFFSSIHCCFVYLRFHWTCLWCISALKEEKNKNDSNLFLFCFVRFKCYCFCL